MPKSIDTEGFSSELRRRAVDVEGRRLLITRYTGTEQEADLSEPTTCNGLGRIRHFRRETSPGWPPNPLPIDPASRALKLPRTDVLRAQVFQNAICNWRCWYCFVPFELLTGNPKHAEWMTPDQLVDCYLAQTDPPPILDLTGGQPDLTPEWVPWMMQVLQERGLAEHVYVWSDDNLSIDYFWRYLTDADRETIAAYPLYGRVGCFKGYDKASFAFNTKAAPELFERQFELMSRLLALGIDVYAYVTLTAPGRNDLQTQLPAFVDRLQRLDENFPLRTVPLEIRPFTPVLGRKPGELDVGLNTQEQAVALWNEELVRRFPASLRDAAIGSIPLGPHNGQ